MEYQSTAQHQPLAITTIAECQELSSCPLMEKKETTQE